VQHDQITALQKGRSHVVQLRNERMETREFCDHRVQAIELELKRLANRLAVQRILYGDSRRSAQSMADAWRGEEVPDLVRIAINTAESQVRERKECIESLEKLEAQFVQQRDERRAELRIAQSDLDLVDRDLAQIDERISGIRGFTL
jgi:hypothetical protein